MQNFGGKQGLSIIGDVQMAKTRALCIITGFKDLETEMQGKTRPLGLVLQELITVSGVRGEGGGGGRLYIISQQKVEEASLFWHRWRNLFT